MKFFSRISSLRRQLLAAGLILLLLFSVVGSSFLSARAQSGRAPTDLPGVEISQGPTVLAVEMNGSVSNLPDVPPDTIIDPGVNDPIFIKIPPGGANWQFTLDAPVLPNMPAAALNFESIKRDDDCGGSMCGGGFPPDTVGDVGPSHYIAAVNTAIAIFNKSGTQLARFRFNQLWFGAATGTACDANNQGDPTVVYDPIGDRWIVADFGFISSTVPPFYECIAVTKTNDPVNGGWYLYAVRGDDAAHPYFPDYPKMGIWTDALYMTANMFNGGGFAESRLWAFNRQQLESGIVQSQIVDTNSNAIFSMLPANLRGTRPPAGRNELVVVESGTAFSFDVFTFHVDWVTPANSTFTGPVHVSQVAYTVPNGNIIPQLNTGTRLDSLGERMMMQTQYTNIAGVESLWVSHAFRTSTSGPTGIQWAQINVTGGTANTTPVQQQQFTNGADGLYRWMPSIAADHQGDAAVGYSASNTSNYPSIRYAGRLFTDTLSALGQGEAILPVNGLGNMNFNCGGAPCHRWGDYTAMTIDPVDNCTFWYVNEYYPTPDGSTVWHTRVSSFRFPSCTPYISFKTNGPDRFINPGYGFDVTLAHADASQQVCLRWSTNAGASWLSTATCTFNDGTGKWACNMPANIDSATITYQFWIGAAGDNCAVTGSETLWTAYNNFATNTRTLTVATAGTGSGVVTPTVGTYTFDYGTVVPLTATADTGSTFTGWSGDLSGGVSPTIITIDANKSVTATFTQDEYTLTVNTVGSGTVAKNPDQGTYHYHDVITLIAAPGAGWAFSSWSGNVTGSTNPVTVTIDGNKVVTATFNSTCSSITGVDFNYTPSAPRMGQPVNFTTVITGGTAPITYTWNFGHGADVITASGDVVHNFPLTTTVQTYAVTLMAANACSTQPATSKQVTVWPYGTFLPLILR